MKTTITSLFIAAMIALLAGCSSTGGSKDEAAAVVEDRSLGDTGGVTTGGARGTRYPSMSPTDSSSPLLRRGVYFED